MAIQNCCEKPNDCFPICAASCAFVVAAGLITMFVMGILGACGTVDIPPIGCRFLIGIPTGLFIGGVISCCKLACK